MLGRFSIRWRLAIISSALTFLVLCGFAIVVGQLTTQEGPLELRQRDGQLGDQAGRAAQAAGLPASPTTYSISPDINVYAASNDAAIQFSSTRCGAPVQRPRAHPTSARRPARARAGSQGLPRQNPQDDRPDRPRHGEPAVRPHPRSGSSTRARWPRSRTRFAASAGSSRSASSPERCSPSSGALRSRSAHCGRSPT